MIVLSIAGCGGGNDSIRGTINGQQFELDVQDVDCVASYASGSAIAGFDGVLSAPLYCTLSYRSDSFFADYVAITVSDIRPIYDSIRQGNPAYYMFDGGLISGKVSMMGQEQPIFYGSIQFTQISNVAGDRVSANFEITTGQGDLTGHFNESVRVGF
jgi:hypothetical protein